MYLSGVSIADTMSKLTRATEPVALSITRAIVALTSPGIELAPVVELNALAQRERPRFLVLAGGPAFGKVGLDLASVSLCQSPNRPEN